MSEDKDVKPDININEHYRVQRSDETWQKATVIETRTTENDEVEYFVHYHNFDRRLDEWVERSRIDLSSKFTSSCETAEILQGNSDSRLTRNQKRKYDEIHHLSREYENMDSMTQKLEKEHQEFTRVKYIDQIQLGRYEINTWYFSPYPEEYRRLTKLWICEFCLKYMRLEKSFLHHLGQCRQRRPPGKEIYRKAAISVFEIDGSEHKLYCQNLCLLAKLFLDHKTLYYDVAPFMFYVLCEVDKQGCHVVGYFSKEKISTENNNLACILILPPFQRKGYGKFLIAFTPDQLTVVGERSVLPTQCIRDKVNSFLGYELAKIEKLIGSPEKPLSDLGRLSYRSYWEFVIFSYLLEHANGSEASIDKISQATCIAPEDIVSVLQSHKLIKYYRLGRQVEVNHRELQEFLSTYQHKRPKEVDRSRLLWAAPIKTNTSAGRTTKK